MISFLIILGFFFVAFLGYLQIRDLKREPQQAKVRRFNLIPLVVMGITLVTTLIVRAHEGRTLTEAANEQFRNEADKIQNAVLSRMHGYEELINGGRNLLDSQPRLEPAALKDYLESQHVEQRYPTLSGFGFISSVLPEALPRFLAIGRRRHAGDFKLNPPGTAPEYAVVQEAFPEARSRGLLGYNVASDIGCRAAIGEARERGQAVLSARILLPDDLQHASFLYLSPVFRKERNGRPSEEGAPVEVVPTLKGWVFARFRQEDLLRNIVHQNPPAIQLQVFDGSDASGTALFFDSLGYPVSGGAQVDGPFVLTRSLEVADRHWILHFIARPGFQFDGQKLTRAGRVFGVGFLLSLLSSLCVWILHATRKRAVSLAREMTLNLSQRNAALSSGRDGIVIVDAVAPEQPIIWVNSRFEKITGYPSSEVIGKNCRLLQGTDREQKALQEIRRGLREQRECQAVLRNYRKDGTPFWNDLTISPVRGEFGRTVEFVGRLSDVTDREQGERRLSTQVAIIRALSESPTIEESAPRILRALCEGQEWELGVFWVLDPRSEVLRCVDIWHHPEINVSEFERFSRATTYSRDQGLPGAVWGKGEPVWVGDLDPRFPETTVVLAQGLSSGCGFPVASRRGLQGVVVFYSRKIWPLSKNLLLLMVTTGNQISQFMERQDNQGRQKEVSVLERGLAEFMGDGLIAMDRDGYCIYANSAAGKMLGYGAATMLGQNVHDMVHPSEMSTGQCDSYRCPVLTSLQSTQPTRIDDHQVFWTRDRVSLPVAYTTSPIINEGLIRGVVVSFVDATAQRLRHDELVQTLKQKEADLQNALAAANALKEKLLLSASVSPRQLTQPDNAANGPKPQQSTTKTVLLLEEDKGVRVSLSEALKVAGFNALQASNASEAMLICERSTEPIDAFITDSILVPMNGKALAVRLRGFQPLMKTIFMSTYSEEAIRELDLLESGAPFLQKPLNTDDLIRALSGLTQE